MNSEGSCETGVMMLKIQIFHQEINYYLKCIRIENMYFKLYIFYITVLFCIIDQYMQAW